MFSLAHHPGRSLGILGADPDSSRIVYGVVIALIVIGVLLIGLAIWVIRQTRVDPELLAPLERMADREWRKRDPAGRRRLLDEVRPEGANPVRPTPEEPEVDDDFEQAERRVPSFVDLPHDLADDAADVQPDEPQDGAPESVDADAGDGVADESPDDDEVEADSAEHDAESERADDLLGDDDSSEDTVAGAEDTVSGDELVSGDEDPGSGDGFVSGDEIPSGPDAESDPVDPTGELVVGEPAGADDDR